MSSCCCDNGIPFLAKLHKLIRKCFYKLGYQIGLNPSYFIIIPFFVSLLGITGLRNLLVENDPEYLYSPSNGPGQLERRSIEELFPMNFSEFHPSVMIGLPLGVSRVLVSAKGDTMLTLEAWNELNKVNDIIQNMTVTWDGEELTYEEMCSLSSNRCIQNTILELTEYMPDIVRGNFSINYPVMLFPKIGPFFYGSPVVDEENHVLTGVKAIGLGYFVRSGNYRERERARIWEAKIVETVMSKSFEHVHVTVEVSNSLETELTRNAEIVKPYFLVNFLLMVTFSCLTLWNVDWVRSKFGLGIVGLISALLSAAVAFGLLNTLGIPFIILHMVILFLVLGIGLDDQYVLISGWHRSKPTSPVPVRLAETYSEAGISITITSLTNVLSFLAGVMSSIPAVSLFCLYAAVTVFFTYLWFICIFGGFLALAGRAEEKNRHSITTAVVKPKSSSKDKVFLYRWFCAGGMDRRDPYNRKDNRQSSWVVFFKDYLAKILTNPAVKAGVFALFFAYIGGAIYGVTHMKEGLERKNLIVDGSYLRHHLDTLLLFRNYAFRLQIVVNESLSYSDPEVKTKILKLHENFEKSKFTGERIFTVSYIRQFYNYLNRRPALRANITSEEKFIEVLQKKYFVRNSRARRDFLFNANNTRIEAVRFVVQAVDVHTTFDEIDWVKEMRDIAKEAPFNTFVYHAYFIFMDQYTMTLGATLRAIIYATVSMAVVAFVFMPHPLCCCVVVFSIISIELGVMGYMALWDVNLDPISMVNIIMCIGFSVDFSAHISYAYITSQADTPQERIRHSLGQLGLPIVQGGISTILGVITLSVSPSYPYRVFFKIIVLVMCFGMAHALLLLPVVFTIINPHISHSKQSDAVADIVGASATSYQSDPKKTINKIDKEDLGIGSSCSSSDSSLQRSSKTCDKSDYHSNGRSGIDNSAFA